MTMLDSVLREKRLRRTQRAQELAQARACCEASAQERATASRAHEEARAYLWQVMTDSEICIQRLSAARSNDAVTRLALDSATEVHAAHLRRASEIEALLARVEKDIEKLAERQEQLRRAEHDEQLKRDWRDLDDWVLGRRGASA